MKPREKLLKYGPQMLEGWELVAAILGTGIQGTSVFELAKKVHTVIEEKKEYISISDLSHIKGIGNVKAIQIISAFELAKRYFLPDQIVINSAQDVLDQVREYRDKKQEYLLCLTLDGANRLIQRRVVTIGLINESLIHPREIFIGAIEDRSQSIIIVHNHPSGIARPSSEDEVITTKLQQASKIIGIKIIDHIIITKTGYFSFKEAGLIF